MVFDTLRKNRSYDSSKILPKCRANYPLQLTISGLAEKIRISEKMGQVMNIWGSVYEHFKGSILRNVQPDNIL